MPRTLTLTDADITPVSTAPIDPAPAPESTPAPDPTPESAPSPEGQPAPSTEAAEPEATPAEAPAAAEPEAEPAAQPEAEGQTPAADDDPELLRALSKVYGPKLRELPEERDAREREIQAGVDRALAEMRQQPAAHEDVLVARTQAQNDLLTLQRIVEQSHAEGTIPDQNQVAGLAARHGYFLARGERWGAYETANAIIEHLTGPELEQLEQSVGREKFAEERAPIDALYNEARTQFRRFINAGTQSRQLTPADVQAQERAFGEFMGRASQALLELGKRVGRASAQKDAQDTYQAQLTIERHNALQRARAEVQAGNPPPPVLTPETKASTALPGRSTLNGDWKSDLEVFERAAGRK